MHTNLRDTEITHRLTAHKPTSLTLLSSGVGGRGFFEAEKQEKEKKEMSMKPQAFREKRPMEKSEERGQRR